MIHISFSRNRFLAAAGVALLFPLAWGLAADKQAEVKAKFTAADVDKDGELDANEAKPYAQLLAGADADMSGKISWHEAWTHLAKIYGGKKAPINDVPPATEKLAPYVASAVVGAPQVISPGLAGVGKWIPDLEFSTLDGKVGKLSTHGGAKGTVIAWLSPSCPVGKRYLPELARLEKAWAEKGVTFLFPAPEKGDADADLKASGLQGPIFRDTKAVWQAALGAEITTDVFVLDAARTIVYRGAIDDQYGVGYSREAASKRYLVPALESLASGDVPEIRATKAPGCELEDAKISPTPSTVTYHREIARFTQKNCVECHRSGGVAPFLLETYEQVSAKAKTILRVLEDETMPPWFAADGPAGHHSPWQNDRSLTAEEKAPFIAWVAAGKPEGDAKEAPVARKWPESWRMGTPDQIWRLPAPQQVKAEGVMGYQKVTVETELKEDKWIQAWEVMPTARQVVHHVLVYLKEPGAKRHRSDNGDHLASYVPGGGWNVYGDGLAKKIKAGSSLLFEMHYTPNGKATEDQTALAVKYASNPPKYEVKSAAAGNTQINIPAQAENHPEVAVLPVPQTVQLLTLNPHMHVRGKAFRYELVLPNGEVKTLLDVPRYDFNWQIGCRYAEPLTVPAGSKIKCTAWYNNSTTNPANPDPNKAIRWGAQTTDEMMLGYLEYLVEL